MLSESHRTTVDGRRWSAYAYMGSNGRERVDEIVMQAQEGVERHVIDTFWFDDAVPRSSRAVTILGRRSAKTGYCEVYSVETAACASFQVDYVGGFRVCDWHSHNERFVSGSGQFVDISEAFETLEVVMSRPGMEELSLCRTWFYIPDIKEAYPVLNAARDTFFDAQGIDFFPASTGIGVTGETGAFRFEFVPKSHRLVSGARAMNLQCPPVEYGPRFERVNVLQTSRGKELLISGISSVEKSGDSMAYRGYDDVDFALNSFSEILALHGASWLDLVSAYCYAINDDVMEAATVRIAGRSNLVVPRLINKICRPDLRFEIEGRVFLDR